MVNNHLKINAYMCICSTQGKQEVLPRKEAEGCTAGTGRNNLAGFLKSNILAAVLIIESRKLRIESGKPVRR
jgi:hypothetical protein